MTGDDPRDTMAILRVLDVLAPFHPGTENRVPIFEWAHETTPTDEEMMQLARKLVQAARGDEGVARLARRVADLEDELAEARVTIAQQDAQIEDYKDAL